MVVYDALASTTAGEGVLSASFSVGSTGDAAAGAVGNVVNVAVNITQHVTYSIATKTQHYFYVLYNLIV